MGVDLATYRARIGTFISRRNVTCDDERRRNASAKRRWRGKNVSKALSTTNLKHMHMAKETSSSTHSLKMQIYTYCTADEFGFLGDVRSFGDNGFHAFENVCFQLAVQGSHRAVHFCVRAKRLILSVVVTSFTYIKQRLLILSGDVEMNPGPLGQRTEGSIGGYIHCHITICIWCWIISITRDVCCTQLIITSPMVFNCSSCFNDCMYEHEFRMDKI